MDPLAKLRPTPGGRKVIAPRYYGRWIVSIILLLIAAFAGVSIAGTRTFDFAAVSRYMFAPAILAGVVRTLYLTALAMVGGIFLGLIAAVGRLSPNPVIATVTWLYVWFFRGTPVLVQLIFWFNIGAVFHSITLAVPFGGPTLFSTPTNSLINPFSAALLGLGLNEGAYMAEIIRAGIISVDIGQSDAAQALGMNRQKVMRHVVLPQAWRVIVPPTGNELIGMLKLTSLASVISFTELLGAASNIYSNNLEVLELLVVASIWYLACTSVLSIGQFFLERKLAAGSGISTRTTLIGKVAQSIIGRRGRGLPPTGPAPWRPDRAVA